MKSEVEVRRATALPNRISDYGPKGYFDPVTGHTTRKPKGVGRSVDV